MIAKFFLRIKDFRENTRRRKKLLRWPNKSLRTLQMLWKRPDLFSFLIRLVKNLNHETFCCYFFARFGARQLQLDLGRIGKQTWMLAQFLHRRNLRVWKTRRLRVSLKLRVDCFNCILKRYRLECLVRNPLLSGHSRDSDRPSRKLRLAKRRNRRGRCMSTKRRRPNATGDRALLDFGAQRRQRRLSRRRRPFCLLLRHGNQRRWRLLRLAVWNVREEPSVPDESRRDRILWSQQHWRLSTRHEICWN